MAQGTNYMTTHKASIALYLVTPHAKGFETDQYGNFIYKSTDTTDAGYWHMDNNDNSVSMRYYWNSGDLWVPGKLGVGYNPATSGNTYKLYVNGTSYLNGATTINSSLTLNDHLYLAAGKHIYMNYNNTNWNIITNYNNGNTGINAAGLGLHIGHYSTPATYIYYTTADNSTRTQFFEVNSNGAYALTRFGVNGQNTSYNFYVNGTSCFTSAITLSGTDSSTAQINFSRTGAQCPNYINAPASAEFGFSIGGVAGANIRLHITNTTVDSWTNNSVSLGTSSIKWNGTWSTTFNNWKLETVSSLNANDVRTSNGLWACAASITNAASTNHSLLLGVSNVGTPFQIQIPDSSIMYIYKRYYSSSTWSDWSKIYAGCADRWTTDRTFTVGATGKTVNGTGNVSWSMNEIMGSSDSTKFYRGDKTWASRLTSGFDAAYIGVTNTTSTNGFGVSLYGGATNSMPTYGIAFAGTGTFGTHVNVSSDWATYFTMNDNTARGWIFRRGTTNVASIDGRGRLTLGYAANANEPGIYWHPGVEGASDTSDAGKIYQIKSGVAGGTELRISQQNDSIDVINICAPYYIYLNSKRAFIIYDSWLRINEDKGFSSGIYTGSSLIRTDNQLQVGSSGNTFLADSNGIKILNRFVYCYASIAALSGNKAEATHWWKIANVTGYFNFTIYVGGRWNWGSPSIIVFNITQREGTVYITQLSGLAGSNCSCVKLGKNSTNDWDLLIRTNGSGSGASHGAMQFDIVGQGGITVYRDVDTATDSTYSNGETTLDITDIYGKNITSSNIGSQSVNYAASAGSVAWANTGHPSTFPPSAHSHDYLPIQNARAAYIYTNTAGAGFQPGSGSALEIREVNLVVANQSAWSYAPKIGFHWGNRVARQFGMNSAGEFCFFNQSSDSSYATIKAGNFNFNSHVYTDGTTFHVGTGGTYRAWIYGDTGAAKFSGRVWINYGQDIAANSDTGVLIVGPKDGENIGLDGNEIMGRKNYAANPIYINWEGGQVNIGGYVNCKAGHNDYAEFRKCEIHDPGRVVIPNQFGSAQLATERLQAGARVISDTFGFAVGESDEADTPMAMTGRVLAYPYRPISEYNIGDAVCSAPNGTVDIMTREEIKEYPERIIGIVNEIPTYAIWRVKASRKDRPNRTPLVTEVEVRGRIWVDVK